MSNCSIYCLSLLKTSSMCCLEGWKQLILNILLYNLPEKREEPVKLQNLPCVITKHLNEKHRTCMFTVPNLISWFTLMMIYLSWYTASVTCCQSHSGHTWSRLPSYIFTGRNDTGKVGAIWNQIRNPQQVMQVNSFLATSPLSRDHPTQQPGPRVIPGVRDGCVQVLLLQISSPETNDLLFSFNQLSPINLLDTKSFPSEWEKNPAGRSHARKEGKGKGLDSASLALLRSPGSEHPRDAHTHCTPSRLR